MVLSEVQTLFGNRDPEQELGVALAFQLQVACLQELDGLVQVRKLTTHADCDKGVLDRVDARGQGFNQLAVQVQ